MIERYRPRKSTRDISQILYRGKPRYRPEPYGEYFDRKTGCIVADPMTDKERSEHAGSMIALVSIRQALGELDATRDALNEARDKLISTVNSQPKKIRVEFERFWRAGGCSAGQWIRWINGELPKERVPVKGGLRLVVKNKTRRRFIQSGDGPRAA